MVLVIDAYNVIMSSRLFDDDKSLLDKRNRLIELARQYAGKKKGIKKVVIVFDGNDEAAPWSRQAMPSNIKVLFSKGGKNADQEIVRFVSQEPHPKEITVVSNDMALRNEVKAFGAQILAVEEMMLRFKSASSPAKQTKNRSLKHQGEQKFIDPQDQSQINEEFKKKWSIY